MPAMEINPSTCPIAEINPMHPENLRCPAIMNRRLIDEAPVFQDPLSGIFFISSYAEVVEMSMDYKTFSSVMATQNRPAHDIDMTSHKENKNTRH